MKENVANYRFITTCTKYWDNPIRFPFPPRIKQLDAILEAHWKRNIISVFGSGHSRF